MTGKANGKAKADGQPASVKAVRTRAHQLPALPTLLLLLAVWSGLLYFSHTSHYELPEPVTELKSHDGTPVFSEKQALQYINDLATYEDGTPRYRIVGTDEMRITEEYVLAAIERIKSEAATAMSGLHQVEVWHQKGSGEHLFDFMDKMVWKKYYDITNVIVRLSDGTPESKANAVLVNAHLDSTLPSPGAADDLVGVAVMLEALRVIATRPRKLTNSVIFLFNGAEESLQDASHLFITKHPLRKTVRSVINLEACGVGGPEIVFQATSTEMIHALAKTPRPYGTVLANEIFGTGLILSDTDFRQFAEYGNLTGLDMALVQNSYLYHTRLDLPDRIEPGAVQHMGDNVIALLEYLTSPETSLGNSPTAKALPKAAASSTIYFSGLGSKVFVVYSRETATLIYTVLAALTAVVLTDRVDWSRRRLYIAGFVGVLGSLVAAVVSANLAAVAHGIVMQKSLTWFRHESLPLLVYGPPAAVGALLFQRTVSNFVRTPFATVAQEQEESAVLEHASLLGFALYCSIVMLAGHSLRIGSAYLVAFGSGTSLMTIIVNDYILQRGKRSVHVLTYIIGQVVPLLLGYEGLVSFLDIFVPLTGRLGADAPVDFIIASLTSAVGFLTVPLIMPLSHRFGPSSTSRMTLFFVFLTAGVLGWFTRPGWNQYDASHPKRILALHMENTTTTPSTFHLHIAAVDSIPFGDLVKDATSDLVPAGFEPVSRSMSDDIPDWDIIYPVSQFLTSYKIPLPATPSSYVSPWTETFKVEARRNVLNSIAKTRELDIVMTHPQIMWPVLAFEGDVVEWDLPRKPEPGARRHHVKSVAAHGVDTFTLRVKLRLSDAEFEAALREQQRAKGQRSDASAQDKRLASVKIDYSGLDSKGMWPASLREQDPAKEWRPGMALFSRLEKKLPDWVDSMLLSAVAGVAYV